MLRRLVTLRTTFPILIACLVPAVAAHAENEHDHHHHMMMSKDSGFSVTQGQYKLPAMKLTDQRNQTRQLDAILDDEPMMVNFIFTTCSAICPIMAATFMEVQKKADQQKLKVKLISFSIDPEEDTPPVLLQYAKKYHAGKDWEFYTGDKNDSIALQKAFNVYRGNKMNHIPITFIRAGKSAPWTRIEGFASASDLMKEFKKLAAH
jgi:protein SCO1/2